MYRAERSAQPRAAVFIARGVLAVALGAIVLLPSLLPVAALIGLFGLYMLGDGVVLVAATRATGERPAALLEALVDLVFGAATLAAIARGLLQILQSIRWRPHATTLAFAGALSLATGIATAIAPAASPALLRLLGLYSVAFGLALMAFAVRGPERVQHRRPRPNEGEVR